MNIRFLAVIGIIPGVLYAVVPEGIHIEIMPHETTIHEFVPPETRIAEHTQHAVSAILQEVQKPTPPEILKPLLKELFNTPHAIVNEDKITMLVRSIADEAAARNLQESLTELTAKTFDSLRKIDTAFRTALLSEDDREKLQAERIQLQSEYRLFAKLNEALANYIKAQWESPRTTIATLADKLNKVITLGFVGSQLRQLFNSDDPLINMRQAEELVVAIQDNTEKLTALQSYVSHLNLTQFTGPVVKAISYLKDALSLTVTANSLPKLQAQFDEMLSAPSHTSVRKAQQALHQEEDEILASLNDLFKETTQVHDPNLDAAAGATTLALVEAQIPIIYDQLAAHATAPEQEIVESIDDIAMKLRALELEQYGILRPFIEFLYMICDWAAKPGERGLETLYDALPRLKRIAPIIRENQALNERTKKLVQKLLAQKNLPAFLWETALELNDALTRPVVKSGPRKAA